jgi:acetyltransferase-like isoleucine patch superfamily enzyme
LKNPFRIPLLILIRIPYFNFIRYTSDYQCPISFKSWFFHKILNLGGNRSAYWPVHFSSKVVNPQNIYAGIDTCPGLMAGCYIQGIGKIYIGDYTQIAANVAIISANHDIYDSRKHIPEEVRIGRYCWIGTGATILPGVTLGDWTIIGAGAVVTKSFPDGYCIIGGVPAQKLKQLEKERCTPFKNKIEYNGYIRSDQFEKYRKKHLKV